MNPVLPKKPALRRLLCGLALLLLGAGVARAGPILTGTATRQADGSYLYQYTLTGPAGADAPEGGTGALQSLDLQGSFPAKAITGISQPSGWSLTEYADGWLHWDSGSPAAALGAGQAGAFSFRSPLAPGSQTIYQALGLYTYQSWRGLTTDYFPFSGQTVGPDAGAPNPTPEPGSATLLAVGGLLLVGCVRRRRTPDKLSAPAGPSE
jgi:hypothetical protein